MFNNINDHRKRIFSKFLRDRKPGLDKARHTKKRCQYYQTCALCTGMSYCATTQENVSNMKFMVD